MSEFKIGDRVFSKILGQIGTIKDIVPPDRGNVLAQRVTNLKNRAMLTLYPHIAWCDPIFYDVDFGKEVPWISKYYYDLFHKDDGLPMEQVVKSYQIYSCFLDDLLHA